MEYLLAVLTNRKCNSALPSMDPFIQRTANIWINFTFTWCCHYVALELRSIIHDARLAHCTIKAVTLLFSHPCFNLISVIGKHRPTRLI
ncbi:hypothetical protein KIN20_007532 [Parelaphostrongylus tenuis]|uniref:Uncharacterized protein n=1 Tax=Parelaphostrongylus tenuis TaxID=148309 RepID=A0AAD5MP94_PARTN|nr:hypothetical protein KIN20_007532 [Parelaphostrongylus tenuis]